MEYRNLGRTGLRVSELCLGTQLLGWTTDEETSFAMLTAAFEAGVNFLDTADMYSRWAPGHHGGESETIIGKWLAKGVARRDQVVIATKVRSPMGEGPNDQGLSRAHVLRAAESSLRRLGIDAIDLYLLHWVDPLTPIEETLAALDCLVQRGDVRYIGCSNFPAWMLMQALWTSDMRNFVRFACVEPHYNIVQRNEFEFECEPACVALGLGVITYSPLAEGFLAGKYQRGIPLPAGARILESRYNMKGLLETAGNWDALDCLRRLGKEHGKTVSQMALGWLLSRPSVTSPIIGPRTMEQLRDNLGAVGLRLSDAELKELDEASDWRKRLWNIGLLDVDSARLH